MSDDFEFGTCITRQVSRGVCFLKSETGAHIFAHISAFAGQELPALGERCRFRIVEGEKGARATDCAILEPNNEW
jgi:cold shock CspA family protein